jgi:hypothetical protein
MCNVIHIRDKKGKDNELYIGRGSKWGNPYRIGTNGTRAEVIRKYRLYAEEKFSYADIQELRGRTLICYCKPKACHGDVLVSMVNDINEYDRRMK